MKLLGIDSAKITVYSNDAPDKILDLALSEDSDVFILGIGNIGDFGHKIIEFFKLKTQS